MARVLVDSLDPAQYDLGFRVSDWVFIRLGVVNGHRRGRSGSGLERDGIRADRVRWNLSVAALYEEPSDQRGRDSRRRAAGVPHRPAHGRSPNDKFVVREASSEAHIAWAASTVR